MQWKNLFIGMALVILSACGHVEIKDQVWYGDKGPLGAKEFHTMTTYTQKIPKDDWDNMRFGMLCTNAQTFGEIKREIEVLCSNYKGCTYPDIKPVLERIDRIILMNKAN